jgi:hypothetical protein
VVLLLLLLQKLLAVWRLRCKQHRPHLVHLLRLLPHVLLVPAELLLLPLL